MINDISMVQATSYSIRSLEECRNVDSVDIKVR